MAGLLARVADQRAPLVYTQKIDREGTNGWAGPLNASLINRKCNVR